MAPRSLRYLFSLALFTTFTGCVESDDPELEADADLEAADELLDEQPTPEELELEIDLEEIEVPFDGDEVELSAAGDPLPIGELACATASISDPTHGARISMSPAPHCSWTTNTAVSPNTSYNPAGCPNQFITEISGTYGRALGFTWNWRGAPLDQTTCGLAHANLSAFGTQIAFVPPFGFEFQSVKLGETRMHGVWYSGFFSWCGWEYDAGYGPIPSLPAGHTYNWVRTAVLATGWLFKQPVEAGIAHGTGPC